MDREHHPSEPGTTRTAAGKDEQPKPAVRKPDPAGEGSPATSAPDIMSRLPKTRPQSSNDRRRAAAADASKPATPARATTPARAPAAARSTAPARSSRKPAAAPKRSAAARGRTAAATRGTAATAATAKPQPRPKATPAAPEPAGGAPSIPRLAVDGATEAVKLPLKVAGRLTLRALDAVARGLRRG